MIRKKNFYFLINFILYFMSILDIYTVYIFLYLLIIFIKNYFFKKKSIKEMNKIKDDYCLKNKYLNI
jgi:hypothetical protein